jgi:hypothetical protein
LLEKKSKKHFLDKIEPVQSFEDEIHNVQAVIDSISLDILHEDLSHITGEGVMNKDIVSIEYLLDILISIEEWLKGNSNIFQSPVRNIELHNDEEYSDLTSSFMSSDSNSRSILKEIGNHPKTQNKIDELKKFLDSSHSSIETLKKVKEKTDEQIKYLELEKEMENTVKMTQNALKNNLPQSLAPLTNSITSKVLNRKQIIEIAEEKNQQRNDETLFSLLQLDNEQRNQQTDANLSSGSLSGIGVLSDIKRKKEQILEKFRNENLAQHRKSVKFDDDIASSERSNSSISIKSDLMANRSSGYRNTVFEHDTTNELSIIRNSIKDKGYKDEKVIKMILKSVYDEDLKDAESLMRQSLDKNRNRSEMTNHLFIDAHRPASSASVLAPNKSVFIADDYKRPLLRRQMRAASVSPSRRNGMNNGQRSQSSLRASLNSGRKHKSKFVIGEDGILSKLLEEFPHLYLAPETIHDLWQKHSKQIEHLQKEQHELEVKYSKDNENTAIRKYLNDTHLRQKSLMDIMRKDIEHMQRVQDLKRKQNVENALKYKAKEQRFQNVKVKNYFEEFRLQQRAKMLKKLTKEEVLFKQLFNESLKIQKERVREMKKYAKEQRDIKTKQQMNQIESIENFYKNKFNLLNEKIKKEKVDNEIREKSQHEILTKMKSQMKNKLESDIRDLQSQLCNDEDFMYWRKLDANRVENDLKCARYKATV